jgi:hypothetical protein
LQPQQEQLQQQQLQSPEQPLTPMQQQVFAAISRKHRFTDTALPAAP